MPGPPDWLLRAKVATKYSMVKFALIVLWSHADSDGWTWLAVPGLAEEMGCDKRTARAALDHLVNEGAARRVEQAGQSAVYRLYSGAIEPHLSALTPDKNVPGSTRDNFVPSTETSGVAGTKLAVPPLTKMYHEVLAVKGFADKASRSPSPTELPSSVPTETESAAPVSPESNLQKMQIALPVVPDPAGGEPAPPERRARQNRTPASQAASTPRQSRRAAPEGKPKPDKAPPDPRLKETMLRLEQLQGPFSVYARDALQVKAMLQRAEPDEIVACWKTVKSDPWWSGKPLSMSKLNEFLTLYQRGELAQQQQSATSPPYRNGAGPGPPGAQRNAFGRPLYEAEKPFATIVLHDGGQAELIRQIEAEDAAAAAAALKREAEGVRDG